MIWEEKKNNFYSRHSVTNSRQSYHIYSATIKTKYIMECQQGRKRKHEMRGRDTGGRGLPLVPTINFKCPFLRYPRLIFKL